MPFCVIYFSYSILGLYFGLLKKGVKDLIISSFSKYLLLEEFTYWKPEPSLECRNFYQLQSAFGWEPFKVVFRHFNEISCAEKYFIDQEKIDYWVFHFSKAVQKNLAPYFSKCNIQVSPPIKEQLKLYASRIPEFLERERGKTKNYTLGHVPNV